jgi:hypothetical protein
MADTKEDVVVQEELLASRVGAVTSSCQKVTADELEEYVIHNYSKLLSKLPSDDPGVFIYYHPDADIDACLALGGAPALVDAAGTPVVPGEKNLGARS